MWSANLSIYPDIMMRSARKARELTLLNLIQLDQRPSDIHVQASVANMISPHCINLTGMGFGEGVSRIASLAAILYFQYIGCVLLEA